MDVPLQSSFSMRLKTGIACFIALAGVTMVVGLATPDLADARSCGNVTFKPDPFGSGGLVSAKGVKCKNARKLILKCGRKGVKPAGWKATFSRKGRLVLKRGTRRVIAQIAGAAPPGAKRCTR